MALPTKKDLLATGLEPIEHEDCAICKDPMKDPVRVPCNGKHAFCKACITKWLKQPNTTTCPLCRQVLCSITAGGEVVRVPPPPVNNGPLPGEGAPANDGRFNHVPAINGQFNHQERDQGRFATVAHRINVDNAFRVIGLGHYIFPHELGNPSITALIMFGDLHISHQQFCRLAPLARSRLTTPCTTRPEGAIKINAQALGSSLVMMGNAIMRIATTDNREWSDANKESWRQMVNALWQLLSPYHGIRLDSRAMFHAMIVAVIERTWARVCPFLCNAYLLDDTMFLLFFLLAHAGEWMPRLTVRAEFEARRISQPLALPRTAVPRIHAYAEVYEAQAFPPRE